MTGHGPRPPAAGRGPFSRWARAIPLFALCVTACTQYWAKPGGTEAEFEVTKGSCGAQSFQQFPPMPQLVAVGGGYITPLQTQCVQRGNRQDCYTVGGQYVPPMYGTVDMNESARVAAFRSCLLAAGWVPAKDKAEAQAITNSGRPPSNPAAALAGANAYCDNIFNVKRDPAMIAHYGGDRERCIETRARELAGS